MPALPSVLVLSVLSVLAGSACSFSASIGDTPTGVAEELIEDDLADQLELEDVVAECGEPPDESVGSTFSCTSSSNQGQVRWEATILDDDRVNVGPLNVLAPEDLDLLEESAVAELESSTGEALGRANLECGNAVTVLGSHDEIVCALTDPANGDVYDTTLTVLDMESGEFRYDVAESPR